MTDKAGTRIVNSALWAASADALGFMSELTDLTGLRRRVHSDRIAVPIEWHRVVGGRYGAFVKLPAGCYSDDTQLRLSTSRAIRGNGYFDVESFAKIELPVWLSYSLGAGVGTKAAAANLSNASVSWFSNFYQNKERSYFDSGGNGAAMRVQPHVWAARRRQDPSSYLIDVVRNSVCTHGSLRAILGAVFHAVILAKTINSGEIQMPEEWRVALRESRLIVDLVLADRELSSFWLPVWEQKTGRSFAAEVNRVIEECTQDINILEKQLITDEVAYRAAVQSTGGLDSSSRGSGTKTALLASALCWGYRNRSPNDAIIVAANLLGSDTDTIGTMAGAIFGTVADGGPVGPLLDRDYIEREALRLHDISVGKESSSFCYPDLMKWSPPKNQTSAVGIADDRIVVAGLGSTTPVSDTFRGQGQERSLWRWLHLEFGQTIIAKMRTDLPQLSRNAVSALNEVKIMKSNAQQNSLFLNEADSMSPKQESPPPRTLDEITTDAIKSGFDPTTIGKHVIELSSRADGIEQCLAYVAIISKARKARLTQRKA